MTRRSHHRGFTLIEVLMATFVIALGVLGLLALFAGAAKQQQVSSQETSAGIAVRSAVGMLEQGFGVMQIPPGLQQYFKEGVWTPLSMHREGYLTVNSGGAADAASFLVDGPPTVLFRFEPSGGYLDDPSAPSEPGFTDTPTGRFGETRSNFRFKHRRIDPDSLQIVVQMSQWIDVNGDGLFEDGVDQREYPPQTRVFRRNRAIEYASDETSERSGRWVVPLEGNPAHDPENSEGFVIDPREDRSWVTIDVEPNPEGDDPARLYEVNIGEIRGWQSGLVERIEVTDYKWRNDQLVSLGDRLRSRADASAPNGRRADQCYSVLFRRMPGGATQACVMAYQLTATSASSEFVPPEEAADLQDNAGPMRWRLMYLHRDVEDPKQFYFRVVEEEDLWIIQPGQRLLIGEKVGMPGLGGASETVKVIRVVRERPDQGSQWRGYIDGLPRVLDPTVVPTPRERPAVRPGQVSDGPYKVYGVADTVKSARDSSVWKLTPLYSQTFEVRLAN